jgi:imidazole glycerol phosphate synthase glutamine amidotransferase subunit
VIAVVDYGVNNLASVVRAVRASGHTAELVANPDLVVRAERVLLPGVGNFGQASRTLASSGLDQAVQEVAASGRPVMGICLGLQLFFALSEEAPGARGLGLLPGRVQRFSTTLPVPHVGWARVDLTTAGRRHTLLSGAFHGQAEFFYHVHSYHPADLPDDEVLATGEYGSAFPTIVGSGSVIGVQFHPEKSQTAGLSLLSAFATWQP